MVYINGIGNVSPQLTFGDVPFLKEIKSYNEGRLSCIEPDYAGWIDPRAIRRMSRVIRMGVASASLALKDAGLEKPEAIITGTALGCLEDTGIFLTKIIENKEQALNPTPFIQSTHNTIGSQVALLLQCYGYNQTYSHRAFSFENALLDAFMMAKEKSGHVLVGGVDEMTSISYDIMNRFGLFKQKSVSSLELLKGNSPKTIPGEGAAYFVLSASKGNHPYAAMTDMATLYKPQNTEEVNTWVKQFMSRNNISASEIDFVLLGKNGDADVDLRYDAFASVNFPNATLGVYKHLCGEFETASSFAMWAGAKILKNGTIPESIFHRGNASLKPKYILLYNQYFGHHHSLILLQPC
jgi:3-oxoacyl-[acyl-carrier-protein] synthase II